MLDEPSGKRLHHGFLARGYAELAVGDTLETLASETSVRAALPRDSPISTGGQSAALRIIETSPGT